LGRSSALKKRGRKIILVGANARPQEVVASGHHWLLMTKGSIEIFLWAEHGEASPGEGRNGRDSRSGTLTFMTGEDETLGEVTDRPGLSDKEISF